MKNYDDHVDDASSDVGGVGDDGVFCLLHG